MPARPVEKTRSSFASRLTTLSRNPCGVFTNCRIGIASKSFVRHQQQKTGGHIVETIVPRQLIRMCPQRFLSVPR